MYEDSSCVFGVGIASNNSIASNLMNNHFDPLLLSLGQVLSV